MAGDPPSFRYYRALQGRWRGSMMLVLRRPRAAQGGGVCSLLSRLFSPLQMDTTVDASAHIQRGEVLHTTRISKAGVTLYQAIETLTLAANGRDVSIERRQRVPFSPFYVRETGKSRAEVDADARRVRYEFALLGGILRQLATHEDDGSVQLIQEAPFLRAEVRLRRL